MNGTTLAVFGIASGILNIIALMPYVRDIFRGKTKPERAAWWIWFALAVIAFGAQVAAGARWSLLLVLSGVIGTGTIAILSLFYGYGKFHKRDTISLIIAGLGVVLAFNLQSPLLALLVVITVDLAGTWLIMAKSWIAPHTETLSAWALTVAASCLGLLSIENYDLAIYLHPVYLILVNVTITLIIIYRRSKVSVSPVDF